MTIPNSRVRIALVLCCVAVGAVLFSYVASSRNTPLAVSESVIAQAELPTSPAEHIDVVHFHGTYQCYSCKTVGSFAERTIATRFPKEYRAGVITFQSLNAELPEHAEIATRYGARGSSLFIRTVIDGEEHIREDVRVWRLIYSEQAFADYLSASLRSALGTS